MPKGIPKNVVEVEEPIEANSSEIELLGEVKSAKVYEVPETKEEYLAVYELLKKLGITRISQLENEIARL